MVRLTLLSLMAVPDASQWLRIGIFLAVLAVIWLVMRFVLRMAMRMFALGCGAILLLGLLLLAFRFFQF